MPADRWFESKPTYARVVILLAGVTMNAVLTICVATSIFAIYGGRAAPTVVDRIIDEDAAQLAEVLGVATPRVAIDGTPVRTWRDLVAIVSAD